MTEPFLKWAGGKRWLPRSFPWLFPEKFDRYVEPFLGGGAVFFLMKPKRALLSDVNQNLMNVYIAIKEDWRTVEAHLREYAERHSNEFYYQVRSKAPEPGAAEAARFLYLNRTCFNGLYRVNLKGVFNVPRGTKNTILMDTDDFEANAVLLADAELSTCDFAEQLSKAGEGDFVFLDPPYTVAHNNNGFLKYNENIFAWSDQERLRDEAIAAAKRGASVLILNAKHDSVERLYEAQGTIHTVNRHSVMSGGATHRKAIEEIAVQIGYSTERPILPFFETVAPRHVDP
jgi:DNA adenine methylase